MINTTFKKTLDVGYFHYEDMIKDAVIPIRVNCELKKRLEVEAKKSKVTLNAFINHILDNHISIIHPFNELGWNYISKSLLSTLLASHSDQELADIAKYESHEQEILIDYVYGNFNHETLLDYMSTFLALYKFPYKLNKETEEFVINHDMGKKWALFFVSVFGCLFDKTGHKVVIKKSSGSILSFSLVSK